MLALVGFRCLPFVGLLTAVTVSADLRVGVGDSRNGYESRDFVTETLVLPEVDTGGFLDLASRARQSWLGMPVLDTNLQRRQVDLGRRLFFDRRLSANGTLSCAMCHVPEQGFTQNELATPVGIEGRSVRRNAPSLYDVAYRPRLFHDGRSDSLETQIWEPLLAENEMGNATRAEVLGRVRDDKEYVAAFEQTYPDGLTEANLGDALASYQRGLISGNSAFDRWFFMGEETLTSEQQQGYRVFLHSGCAACHLVDEGGAPFTDEGFYNTGVGARRAATPFQPDTVQIAPGVVVPLRVDVEGEREDDSGLMELTGAERDRWKYRTPSLRNVALTGPYMHDGSMGTLEEVVDFYDEGAFPNPGLDFLMIQLNLDEAEKRALAAFLESLTGDDVDVLAADARGTRIGDNM